MKNIHVLPTDQPSRLYLEYGDGDLCLSRNLLPQTSKSNNQHIYITSDEEIKEGDAVIHYFGMGYEVEYPCEHDNLHSNTRKKIILTTDTTLIADGVQSISYHFLEWFVKNPTCEFVDIGFISHSGARQYKIIIPREEPKTLEEAAENYGWRIKTNTFSDPVKANDLANSAKQDFIEGAKWQSERMYSEEEVKNIVDKTIEKFYKHRYGDKTKAEMKELWFENFKKK
jgi:hypothetical protein